MPASMISADTGGRPNVIGSSIAMVAVGPRPGSTPISVPRKTPDQAVEQIGERESGLQAQAEVRQEFHDGMPLRNVVVDRISRRASR